MFAVVLFISCFRNQNVEHTRKLYMLVIAFQFVDKE